MTNSHQFQRERAYALLIDLIFSSDFDPSEPLSERGLAEQFSMGRMPVREALRQLEQEGVVEVRPARGTFVRTLISDDIVHIYRVREVLECAAAADAAARTMPRSFANIGTKLRVMLHARGSFSPAEIDDAGEEFHEELVNAAGNPALAEAIRLFRNRFRLAFSLPRYFSDQQIVETLQEHISVYEAVEARDAPLAAERMREHLARGLKLRLALEAQKHGAETGSKDTNSGVETKS